MSELRQVEVEIESLMVALIMHNGELADPLAYWSGELRRLIAELKARKKQGDPEHEMRVAHAEWNGSLWYDEENQRPMLPSDAIEGTIRDGGKAAKKGKQAAGSVRCLEDMVPLIYEGPKTRKELFELVVDGRKPFVDRRSVVVGKNRVVRTRPRFNKWSAKFTLQIDTTAMAEKHVKEALIEAGLRQGLGDYRPGSPKGGKFGTFIVKSWK